jgi:hypothetical protein
VEQQRQGGQLLLSCTLRTVHGTHTAEISVSTKAGTNSSASSATAVARSNA